MVDIAKSGIERFFDRFLFLWYTGMGTIFHLDDIWQNINSGDQRAENGKQFIFSSYSHHKKIMLCRAVKINANT